MIYLSVRLITEDFYFTQSLVERDLKNNFLVHAGKRIETIVVKVFTTESDANRYCLNMNIVSLMLTNVFKKIK